MKELNAHEVTFVSGATAISDNFSQHEKDIYGFGFRICSFGTFIFGSMGALMGSVAGPQGAAIGAGIGVFAINALFFTANSNTADNLEHYYAQQPVLA